jgi:hypothetical protein
MAGILFGVVKEQYPDHLLLTDDTRVPVAAGQVVELFSGGTAVTINFHRDDRDQMIVHEIRRSAAIPPFFDR